jgi:signal transduction histidine kinase
MVADARFGWARLSERAGGVRVRTTAVAVIVVGVALLVSGIAMIVLLRRSLTADVRTGALLRAESVVNDLSRDAQNGPIAVGNKEEEFVQVLDAEGEVIRSSENLTGRGAVARLEPGESREIEGLPFEDDPFLVVAVSGPGSEDIVVVVGRTLETVTESSQAVTGIVVAGIPLLLAIMGAVMWHVVGRALAPVEAIRVEVDAISTNQLHRRVPDPPGDDEVARLAATMNRMLARLEAGQARRRRFVSDASHELRSPLATLRQYAEVALSHPGGSTVEELAEVVLEEDVRLQRLVDALLLLARMDEGTLSVAADPVDLDDILFEEAKRLRASTKLQIDRGRVSGGRVSGDKVQLARLVRNLTDNAARHARGIIALSLQERDRKLVLTIDDDGDGVPVPERRRVFERFVRLEEARDRDSGGSGLGLAIVAEIAAAHGAAVEVVDSPLGGARFEVRFPAG